MMKDLNTRKLAFTGIMAALGNLLFIFSSTIFNWLQVSLDLSHIGTLISAIYGGPLTGLVTGILIGIGPGIYYGFMTPTGGLGPIGLIGLPAGKALTGLSVGLLAKSFNVLKRKGFRSWLTVLAVAMGYVPECIFTIIFFLYILPFFVPREASLVLISFLVPILAKAWVEISMMGFFMGALTGNKGFIDYVRKHWLTTLPEK